MDTVTHGIAGALLGKALFDGEDLFSGGPVGRRRILSWSAMLGAIFPDSDVFRDVFSRNELLVMTWHRSVTHSLICLPAFALGLASLTQWVARKCKWDCPSFALLTLVYAVGIASHILLDLCNNFGTMVWSPLAWSRPAWDLLVIIDVAFSALLLLPQLLAGLYEQKEKLTLRAARLWLLSAVVTVIIAGIAQALNFPLSTASVIGTIAVLAALIFLPMVRGWGFRVSRVAWCRAGLAASVLYIGGAAFAHHAALERVKQFAQLEHLEVQSLAASPLPPSLWHWDGLIRTERGVYDLRMDLSKASRGDPSPEASIEYAYYPDALDNPYIELARELPQVKTFLWFARFPVTRYRRDGDTSIVEFIDLRFAMARRGQANPFTYRVRFDSFGRIISRGRARR